MMLFLCYPRVSKENNVIARVRRENRCVTDRASCIICKARCEMKMRDLLFTKLAESFLLHFPVRLSTSHGVFYLLFNVALSWESRDLTAPPRNCAHRVLPNSNHPAHAPTPLPVEATGRMLGGTGEQVPERLSWEALRWQEAAPA